MSGPDERIGSATALRAELIPLRQAALAFSCTIDSPAAPSSSAVVRMATPQTARAAFPGDGSTVAFQSLASGLTCAKRCARHERDLNLVWDVFLFDLRSAA
jgi:hypothetical protein